MLYIKHIPRWWMRWTYAHDRCIILHSAPLVDCLRQSLCRSEAGAIGAPAVPSSSRWVVPAKWTIGIITVSIIISSSSIITITITITLYIYIYTTVVLLLLLLVLLAYTYIYIYTCVCVYWGACGAELLQVRGARRVEFADFLGRLLARGRLYIYIYRERERYIYIYIHIHTHIHTYWCIYIYIYREREMHNPIMNNS